MTQDYSVILSLLEVADEARKKAMEASKPWEEAARRVARSRGLYGSGAILLEKTRFRILCRGTGIYAHEEWWESFPIELLMAEMNQEKR
jgi:hypothetical protein